MENLLFLPEKYNWETINEKYDWIKKLRGCPQSPIHHAEGDVWIHTKMVVEQLLNHDSWSSLKSEQQKVLYAAALLHDVEKPSCTREENGDIVSPGHAKKGEYTARKILLETDCSFSFREQICKLVRYHGLPIWFMEKPNSVRAVIEASLQVDTELLALLAEVDMKGRICTDLDDMLYRIDLFREFCKEQDCYGKAREFSSNHSRFVYFYKDDSFPGIDVFDDTICEVTLMSGIPGVGKNTWIKKHRPGVPVIELDEIRKELGIKPTDNQGHVIQLAKERAKEFLRRKQNFIWNATNTTRQMRSQLIDLFASYGASITIVYLDANKQTILSQNKNRDMVVPEQVIEKLINKLEVPNLTECHELLIF